MEIGPNLLLISMTTNPGPGEDGGLEGEEKKGYGIVMSLSEQSVTGIPMGHGRAPC